MERDKVTDVLQDVGALVLANACGPCIGQVCAMSCYRSVDYSAEQRYSGNGTSTRTMKTVRNLVYCAILKLT